MLWGRADGLRQEGASNALGTFTFNSIDDFAAGPRVELLAHARRSPRATGAVWNAAAALAHHVRADALLQHAVRRAPRGRRLRRARPPRNPALEQALGVRTGAAPARLHVSPRVGFTYTYNRDRDNGNGTNQNHRRPLLPHARWASMRGGIGEFRDLLRPGILADASAATGLPGGTSMLSCVGAAVPAADWSSFDADPTPIPTQCRRRRRRARRACAVGDADRSGVRRAAQLARVARLEHERRSTLLVRVGGLASYDLAQPGIVDANFAGDAAARARRREATGRCSCRRRRSIRRAARCRQPSRDVATQFGRVASRVSDLRGYGGQLTLGLSPDVFKFRGRGLAVRVAELHAAVDARQYPRLRRRRLRRSARARVGAEPERRAPRRRADRRHSPRRRSARSRCSRARSRGCRSRRSCRAT